MVKMIVGGLGKKGKNIYAMQGYNDEHMDSNE